MEVSDEQFERLVALIAESRTELRQGLSDLQLEVRTALASFRSNQRVIRALLGAVEDDLGDVQRTQREQGLAIAGLAQATDGLTQLGKTNFDMNESILKELHGKGSGTVSHGQESHGSGPQ